jgi:hypothetical protein
VTKSLRRSYVCPIRSYVQAVRGYEPAGRRHGSGSGGPALHRKHLRQMFPPNRRQTDKPPRPPIPRKPAARSIKASTGHFYAPVWKTGFIAYICLEKKQQHKQNDRTYPYS